MSKTKKRGTKPKPIFPEEGTSVIDSLFQFAHKSGVSHDSWIRFVETILEDEEYDSDSIQEDLHGSYGNIIAFLQNFADCDQFKQILPPRWICNRCDAPNNKISAIQNDYKCYQCGATFMRTDEINEEEKEMDFLQHKKQRLRQYEHKRSKVKINRHNEEFWKTMRDKCLFEPDLIKSLIINNIINMDDCDENKNTLLLIMAEKGSYELVKLCLNLGADITHKNNNLETALDLAKKNGFNHIKQLLLFSEMKANIGHRIKNTSNNMIKQRAIIRNVCHELCDDKLVKNKLITSMINIIKNKKPFSDDLLNVCWQFMLDDGIDPLQTELWSVLLEACKDVIGREEAVRKDWDWLQTFVIPSTIWFRRIDVKEQPEPEQQDIESLKTWKLPHKLTELQDINSMSEETAADVFYTSIRKIFNIDKYTNNVKIQVAEQEQKYDNTDDSGYGEIKFERNSVKSIDRLKSEEENELNNELCPSIACTIICENIKTLLSALKLFINKMNENGGKSDNIVGIVKYENLWQDYDHEEHQQHRADIIFYVLIKGKLNKTIGEIQFKVKDNKIKLYLYNELWKLIEKENKKMKNKVTSDIKKISGYTELQTWKLSKDKLIEIQDINSLFPGKQYTNLRQDNIPNGMTSKYTYDELSKFTGVSETFNAHKFYDYNEYLSNLVLLAETIDDDFHKSIHTIFSIHKYTNNGKIPLKRSSVTQKYGRIKIKRGPVKSMDRLKSKAENELNNELYPTTACINDFNRCTIICENTKTLLSALSLFINKVNDSQAKSGNIIGIVEFMNLWENYDHEEHQEHWADIRFYVLIKGKVNNLIGEIQFNVKEMMDSKYGKKQHYIYELGRQREYFENALVQQIELKKYETLVQQIINDFM